MVARRKPLTRPLPIARSPLKRSTKPIRKRSRSKAERERIYGPPGYVEWLHEQPCVTPDNLVRCDLAKYGVRKCRTCDNARHSRRYWAKKSVEILRSLSQSDTGDTNG